MRRPTASSVELSQKEKQAAVVDLASRLSKTADRPLIIFTYKEPWTVAGPYLAGMGYQVLRTPGPYAKTEVLDVMMAALRTALGPP